MGGRGQSFGGSRQTYQNFSTTTDQAFFNSGAMQQAQSQWESGLTKAENNAVSIYTGSGYVAINKSLYKGGDSWKNHSQAQTINDLTAALNKFNLKQNITVTRGQSSSMFGGITDPGQLQGYVGKTITLDGFVSTSCDTSPAFSKPIMLKMNIPKGKGRGAYVANLSTYHNEKEFLVNKGKSFKIGKIYSSGSKTIVEMTMTN